MGGSQTLTNFESHELDHHRFLSILQNVMDIKRIVHFILSLTPTEEIKVKKEALHP